MLNHSSGPETLLSEVNSLLHLVRATQREQHESAAWKEIEGRIAKQERALFLLSDYGSLYEQVYDAFVAARLASRRAESNLVVEALNEALTSLKSEKTPTETVRFTI